MAKRLTLTDVDVRLNDLANDYNYDTHRYRHDQYTRQSASSLLRVMAPLMPSPYVETDLNFMRDYSTTLLQKLDYERGDWRDAADSARVLTALRRILIDMSNMGKGF